MGFHVIDTVHQQCLASRRPQLLGLDRPGCTLQHELRVEMHSSGIAVAFRRQVHHEHARPIGRLPPVLGAVASKATPENGVVEAEISQNLWHLSDMPKQIGQIADGHRRAELRRDSMPALEVPHQRLAADEKLVRHVVPRANQYPALGDESSQSRLVLGSQLEVVLEHDGLAVKVKVSIVGLRLHQVEQPIDETYEADAKLLKGEIPLPVPVGVRDDVRGHFCELRGVLDRDIGPLRKQSNTKPQARDTRVLRGYRL